MATPSGSNNSGAQARQRRVLPARPRRAGTGVGSCDADVLILDTRKRQFENGPLIPAESEFLLTTNTSLVPLFSSSAASELEVNNHVKERYFDRPEVLKAFKEQQVIQTPEFQKLGEVHSVGGRFRPRGSDDQEDADTSDAAYEKRHRKYETFEKRQRLREKEKLKHEQYKLKERIEQLRAMDGTAFLALPASSFSPIPGSTNTDEGTSHPGAHVNGAAAHNEGERRRKEMLDVGMTLEERYRTLLPPDRKGGERERQSFSASVEPEHAVVSDHESDLDAQAIIAEPSKKEREKLKLRIKFPQKQTLSSSHHSASPKPSPSTKKNISALPPITQPLRTRQSKATLSSPPPTPLISPSLSAHRPDYNTRSSTLRSPSALSPSFTPTSVPSPYTDDGLSNIPESPSHIRPRKRLKPSVAENLDEHIVEPYHAIEPIFVSAPKQTSNHRPHHATKSYIPQAAASLRAEQTSSVLVIAAMRTSGAPNARKTQRNVTAFGTKIPWELDEVMDYELPPWVRVHGESHEEAVTDGFQDLNGTVIDGEMTGDDPVAAEG